MEFKIQDQWIGLNHPTYFIADGSDQRNHYANGFLISKVSRMTCPFCISSE